MTLARSAGVTGRATTPSAYPAGAAEEAHRRLHMMKQNLNQDGTGMEDWLARTRGDLEGLKEKQRQLRLVG